MPRLFVILLTLSLLLSIPSAPATSAQPVMPLPQAAAPAASINCSASPTVAGLLNQVNSEQWVGWIRKLSGAEQVTVGGQPYTIRTRYTPALFHESTPGGRSMAFDFVRETILQWYDPGQIEEDTFLLPDDFPDVTLKNLVLTIPGTQSPEQAILLTAHLDSISNKTPYLTAPGADDNATGSAALLEAARVLQGHRLQRTIRLIWYTGEEQGLEGSKAYVKDHDLSGIVGVINLDMFGYDADHDRCFELHVGTLPASDTVGSCFAQSIEAYNINLIFDYINSSSATRSSDHVPFWDRGIGALEVLNNHYGTNTIQKAGCPYEYDRDPNYHQITDTIDKLHLPFGFDITRAALATAFSLANPLPLHMHYFPLLTNW